VRSFNAELERGRAIEDGMRPADREPFAEPRDTRKMDPEQKPA
jgi:membrane protein